MHIGSSTRPSSSPFKGHDYVFAHFKLRSLDPSKQVAGLPDQGLACDTAVHLGSPTAVIVYFRHEFNRPTAAVSLNVQNGQPSADSHFAFNLPLTSLPIIPLGYFTRFMVEAKLRGIKVIAFTAIVFGIALWFSDYM